MMSPLPRHAHPFAPPTSSPAGAPPAPGFDLLAPGAGVSLFRHPWDDPESAYARRHANFDDGDLRAVPEITRVAPSRFAGQGR